MAVSPHIVFVVAVADNGVIGKDNGLPWRLPSDLKRFKALTLNKPVIMGRKTFESIGRPLPGRTNIVLTRDKEFCAPGVIATTSQESALQIAKSDAQRRGTDTIAVIGGSDIFALYLPRANRIELTRVHATPDGDAFFATPDADRWEETGRQPVTAREGDSAEFTYVTYHRRAAG